MIRCRVEIRSAQDRRQADGKLAGVGRGKDPSSASELPKTILSLCVPWVESETWRAGIGWSSHRPRQRRGVWKKQQNRPAHLVVARFRTVQTCHFGRRRSICVDWRRDLHPVAVAEESGPGFLDFASIARRSRRRQVRLEARRPWRRLPGSIGHSSARAQSVPVRPCSRKICLDPSRRETVEENEARCSGTRVPRRAADAADQVAADRTCDSSRPAPRYSDGAKPESPD